MTTHGIQINNIKTAHGVFRRAVASPDWQDAAHSEFFISD